MPEPRAEQRQLSGDVLRVDRFGNLVTNVDRRSFEQFAAGRPIEITAAGHPVTRLVATYADAEAGIDLRALRQHRSSRDRASRGGSAAERLDLSARSAGGGTIRRFPMMNFDLTEEQHLLEQTRARVGGARGGAAHP